MCEHVHVKEQWQLLQSLRSTVEGLLVDGVPNVWNVYGGLNRLHSIMERIFKHGCRIFDRNGEPDCWIFIQGLNWLQPALATSPVVSEGEDYLANLPARITSQKDMLWLYKSLENHSLSQKLSWLLSDKEHLLSCLEPWAYLCQENLAEATLMCLKAVERNQPVLLAEIDPSLFLPSWISPKASPRRHRRSSSYPINYSSSTMSMSRQASMFIVDKCQLETIKRSNETRSSQNSSESQADRRSLSESSNKENNIALKTWNSLPALTKHHKSLIEVQNLVLQSLECKETGTCRSNSSNNNSNDNTSANNNNNNNQSSPVELSEIININYAELSNASFSVNDKSTGKTRKMRNKAKAAHTENKIKEVSENSDVGSSKSSIKSTKTERRTPPTTTQTHLNRCATDPTQLKVKPRRKTSFLPSSAPEFTGSWSRIEIEGQKDIRTPKKSFMEDGGSSVQPMSTGYFPQPTEGQSLTSFLSSAQFARANAELDRENAHFSISEAMIAAIEQVKCNRQWCLMDDAAEESDEEINNLKQKIRIRRRQRQQERCRGKWNRDLLSDGKTDTTTTDQSISPLSTSSCTPSDSISTDDVEDIEVDSICCRSKRQKSKISASVTSLYSNNDLHQSPKHGESALTESFISAEGVALSLISRFNEKQLPRASELQWLVSEKDAPQRLLPLPNSWPVSPDETEIENSQAISLRGTVEWAPPRPQIIFTPHLPPARKTLIAKQNYMCAGCGMKVAVKYANKFRYCEYLGRYFCTGCHTNQVASIPGKILSKWDFNRYPVSNFSYRLLDQMTLDPLFQVNDLNPLLYRRIKQLDRAKLLRTQLFFFKDFLFTCRFATSLQKELKKYPDYLLNDPHVYSIQDLMHVKLGILHIKLQELVQLCSLHIVDCELCQARGFVCELCYSKEVIFPWELSKVVRCETCGACFHLECKRTSKNTECPRCTRLQARRISKEVAL